MAVITSLSPMRRERRLSRQRTDVVGFYGLFELDGRKFVQIDTQGSAERENPGKQSQTIQLDEVAALQLWKLLGDHFGLKKA